MPLFPKPKFNLTDDETNQPYSERLVSLFKNKIPLQQIGAEQESMPMQQQPEKQGLFKRIGSALFGTNTQPEYDENGIVKPHAEQRSLFSKAMPYLLSSVFGGLPAGLLAGYAMNAGRDKNSFDHDTNRYLKEKTLFQKDQYGDRNLDIKQELADLKKANQDNLNEYRSAMAGSARVRANAAKTNSLKPGRAESDTERFIRLKNIAEAKGVPALTPGDAVWLHTYSNKLNKVKSSNSFDASRIEKILQ